MPTLDDIAREHTDLGGEDLAWLSLLMADWQIIADLSFADLVLWLPDRAGTGFWAAGQMRPTTGPTALLDDVLGTFIAAGRRPLLDAAYTQGRVVREGDPEWRDDVPVRVETIPVRRGGEVIAVIGRNTNLLGVRTPSRLELSYLQTAADLTQMISRGHFPVPGARSDHADSPRVGDGFVRVDASGRSSGTRRPSVTTRSQNPAAMRPILPARCRRRVLGSETCPPSTTSPGSTPIWVGRTSPGCRC